MLLSAAPLARYYCVPKQDFLGATRAVQDLGWAGDTRVGVRVAGHVLNGYYHAAYRQAETLPGTWKRWRPAGNACG
jgi:hypothetical protein